MKISEPIGFIRSVLSHGPVSDDFRISERLAYHIFKVLRAKLLYEKDAKYHLVDRHTYQTMCVDLVCDDISEATDYSVRKIHSADIPQLVVSRNNVLLESIQTEAGRDIDLTEYRKVSRHKHSRNRKGRPYLYFKRGKIYIEHGKKISRIYLTGVFTDPAEVYLNSCYYEGDCKYALDADAHTPPDILDTIYKMSYEHLAGVLMSLPVDELNDARSPVLRQETK